MNFSLFVLFCCYYCLCVCVSECIFNCIWIKGENFELIIVAKKNRSKLNKKNIKNFYHLYICMLVVWFSSLHKVNRLMFSIIINKLSFSTLIKKILYFLRTLNCNWKPNIGNSNIATWQQNIKNVQHDMNSQD